MRDYRNLAISAMSCSTSCVDDLYNSVLWIITPYAYAPGRKWQGRTWNGLEGRRRDAKARLGKGHTPDFWGYHSIQTKKNPWLFPDFEPFPWKPDLSRIPGDFKVSRRNSRKVVTLDFRTRIRLCTKSSLSCRIATEPTDTHSECGNYCRCSHCRRRHRHSHHRHRRHHHPARRRNAPAAELGQPEVDSRRRRRCMEAAPTSAAAAVRGGRRRRNCAADRRAAARRPSWWRPTPSRTRWRPEEQRRGRRRPWARGSRPGGRARVAARAAPRPDAAGGVDDGCRSNDGGVDDRLRQSSTAVTIASTSI